MSTYLRMDAARRPKGSLLAGVLCASLAVFMMLPFAVDAVQSDRSIISSQNVFDAERKPWPDIVPPPPPVQPLTQEEVQIYGTVVVGGYKRAIVKLQGRLKNAVPQPGPQVRPYVTLSEGQSVGSYVLSEIHQNQLVFTSGAAYRQAITFNTKTDRVAVPAAVQAPAIQAPVPVPATAAGPPPADQAAPPPAGAAPVPTSIPPVASVPPAVSSGSAPAIAPVQPSAQPATPPAPAPSGGGMSLLEAIQAAQAAAASGNVPSTPNPFQPRR